MIIHFGPLESVSIVFFSFTVVALINHILNGLSEKLETIKMESQPGKGWTLKRLLLHFLSFFCWCLHSLHLCSSFLRIFNLFFTTAVNCPQNPNPNCTVVSKPTVWGRHACHCHVLHVVKQGYKAKVLILQYWSLLQKMATIWTHHEQYKSKAWAHLLVHNK